jgi:hypothetical protein
VLDGGATTGAWSIVSGGGSLSSTAQTSTPQNVTYTPAANFSGTVTLRLTTNDPTGPCPAVFDERTITVNPLPTAPTVTGAAICGPGVVDLSANGCAGGTLNWYSAASGGTLVNTGTTYSPNISSTTSYWVSCTDGNGCVSARTQVTGTVNAIPGLPTAVPSSDVTMALSI